MYITQQDVISNFFDVLFKQTDDYIEDVSTLEDNDIIALGLDNQIIIGRFYKGNINYSDITGSGHVYKDLEEEKRQSKIFHLGKLGHYRHFYEVTQKPSPVNEEINEEINRILLKKLRETRGIEILAEKPAILEEDELVVANDRVTLTIIDIFTKDSNYHPVGSDYVIRVEHALNLRHKMSQNEIDSVVKRVVTIPNLKEVKTRNDLKDGNIVITVCLGVPMIGLIQVNTSTRHNYDFTILDKEDGLHKYVTISDHNRTYVIDSNELNFETFTDYSAIPLLVKNSFVKTGKTFGHFDIERVNVINTSSIEDLLLLKPAGGFFRLTWGYHKEMNNSSVEALRWKIIKEK